jgi:hypothetical protein
MRRCILFIIVLSFCSFYGHGQLPEKALNAGECDISSFPYEEGAENPTVLFDCWTNYSTDSDGKPWDVYSDWGLFGNSIYHYWGESGEHLDDWLVSPKIALPAGKTYRLSFWSYNEAPGSYPWNNEEGPDTGNSVWISIGSDNPTSSNDFVKIWSPTSVSDSWSITTYDLSAYAGEEIYIAFRYNATYTHAWYQDDIKVEEVATVDCSVISEFPYVEGANASASLPECWTNYSDGESDGKPWNVYLNWGLSGDGENSIVHTNDENEHLDDWLVSPKIAIPEGTYRLSFWTYDYYPEKYPYPTGDNPYSGNSVWISKTGDDPTADNHGFVKIWSPQSSVNNSWSLVTYDLSEYAGEEIYIAFRYNAVNGHEWYLDDIKINNSDCTVSSFPYNQGWEDDDFLDCWNIYNRDGGGNTWETITSNSHSGDRSIFHYFNYNDVEDGWLVSPKVSVPEEGLYVLSFWEYYSAYTSYDPSEGKKSSVLISEDAGDFDPDNFEEIWSPEKEDLVGGEWVQTKIYLDEYVGKDIHIAFRYQGLDGHYWVLDDLKIERLPESDAGVTAILSPRSGGNGEAEPVRIKVKNYGEALVDVPVKLEIDDQVVLTGSVSAIARDEEVEYEFTQTVDLSALKTYSLKAYTELTDDANTANDTVTATVITVSCPGTIFPYSEDAEDETALLCWSAYSLGAISDNVWKTSSAFAHSETKSIYHDNEFPANGDLFTAQDDWFVSPRISIPDEGIHKLSFWSYNNLDGIPYPSGGNSVWISDGSPDPTGDNHGSFVQLWSPETVADGEWVQTELRLADYAGEDIYIAFRYNAGYRHEWYVDDIGVTRIEGADAAVTAITSPVTGENRSQETITIKVKNLGSTSLSNIPVKAEINGTTEIEGSISSLLVNEEKEYSFPDKADLSAVGTYNIKVYTSVEGDIDARNDTATVSVTNNGNVAVIGVDTEVTTCNIRFTDDAIDDDYHGLNEDGKTTQTITFHPAGTGNRLKVEFASFFTKPFDTHGWFGGTVYELPGDTLFIYSGNAPDENALLAALTDNLTGNLPPAIRSRAADGSLTFVFDKHKNTTAPGWDAQVSCFVPQPKDVGVNKIAAPLTGGEEAAQVKVLIENYGSESASGFSVAYSLDGAPAIVQNFTGTIAPRTTVEFTFAQTVDLTKYKTFQLEAYTQWTNDGDVSNDTASVSFQHLKNVELYGYRIWDDAYENGTMTENELFANVSFGSYNPETVTSEHTYREGMNFICAAEYVDGFIYGYTGDEDYVSVNFVKLKADDWTEVSKVSAPGRAIADMTYDYSTNTMYVVTLDFENEVSALHTVDLATGALTKVADLTDGAYISTFAADLNGRLYAVELSGVLLEVDKTNGNLTIIGDTGIQPNIYVQSMTFDHNTGRLFWAMYTSISYADVFDHYEGKLIELNPETGAVTDLGSIGTNAEIVGLYTIYDPDDVGLPKVSNQDLITVYPNPATGAVYVSAIPDKSSLSIIDLSGKVLETHASVSGTVRLDLHLNSGVYIIRIENISRNVMKKLLVK